jgi:hypothetical protein
MDGMPSWGSALLWCFWVAFCSLLEVRERGTRRINRNISDENFVCVVAGISRFTGSVNYLIIVNASDDHYPHLSRFKMALPTPPLLRASRRTAVDLTIT